MMSWETLTDSKVGCWSTQKPAAVSIMYAFGYPPAMCIQCSHGHVMLDHPILTCRQDIQSSTRLLERVMRKVDSPISGVAQSNAYFQNIAEAVSAFGAAAAQACVLRGAAESPAAELLQVWAPALRSLHDAAVVQRKRHECLSSAADLNNAITPLRLAAANVRFVHP